MIAKQNKNANTKGPSLWKFAAIVLACAVYLLSFAMAHIVWHRDATLEMVLIRGSGTLSVILLVGRLLISPLAALNTNFRVFSRYKRLLEVIIFCLCLIHGLTLFLDVYADAPGNAILNIFLANRDYFDLRGFPFEVLGFLALALFFPVVIGAKKLREPTKEGILYAIYFLLVLHILLGALQYEKHPVYFILLIGGTLLVGIMQLLPNLRTVPNRRSREGDQLRHEDRPDRNFKVFVPVMIYFGLGILGVVTAFCQKELSTGEYEKSEITRIQGVLTLEPIPMLNLFNSPVPYNLSQHVVLVGKGKKGAEETIRKMTEKTGPLENREVILEGVLIYRHGRALLELRKEERSLVQVFPGKMAKLFLPETLGQVSVVGEVIDPKCYFGASKPGEGKTHRSCAALAISGGLPPMLMSRDKEGNEMYYILKGPESKPVNPWAARHAGKTVRLEGELIRYADWMVLRFDPDK